MSGYIRYTYLVLAMPSKSEVECGLPWCSKVGIIGGSSGTIPPDRGQVINRDENSHESHWRTNRETLRFIRTKTSHLRHDLSQARPEGFSLVGVWSGGGRPREARIQNLKLSCCAIDTYVDGSRLLFTIPLFLSALFARLYVDNVTFTSTLVMTAKQPASADWSPLSRTCWSPRMLRQSTAVNRGARLFSKLPKNVYFLSTAFAPRDVRAVTRRPPVSECRVDTTSLCPNVPTGHKLSSSTQHDRKQDTPSGTKANTSTT